MSCPKWREDIVAWLDRSLAVDRVEALGAHLADCPDCARFHAGEAELSRLLKSVADIQLEPPARIWHRIESEITETQPAGFSFRPLMNFFRLPRLSYGLTALAVMIVTGMVAIHTREAGPAADEVMARLDAFHIPTSENPFLAPMEERNPFFILERDEPNNPFQPGGGLK